MPTVTPTTVPYGLEALEAGDRVTIRLRWFSGSVIPLAVFAVFWNGLLAAKYRELINAVLHPSLWTLPFILPHAGIGIYLIYWVLTRMFNRTDVQISPEGVRVWQGPLSLRGNGKGLSAAEISAVAARACHNDRRGVGYEVVYADRVQKERLLIGSLSQSDQAQFIAAIIRQRLGLRETGDSAVRNTI